MSEKIDENIVSMKFNNRQFESGVATSMSSLDKLKQSLKMTEATKGLNDVNAAANRISLDKLGTSADGISAKFLALSTVAVTALATITNKAVDAGLSLAKSLTIDPIKAGFDEYELKMRSIQTILANTARYGTTLEDVNNSLNELNEYSDKTIYNFGEMTKNIGLFTNAGIKLEDATAAIKGFSNEAAASGTGSQEAANAAYQLSQALSAGTIRLMDWRSLTNAGMGNANMKDGLIDLATAMGQFEGQTETAKLAQENFNASLEKEWLSADVMMNYLKIQAGELNAEQMRSLGLTDAQIKRLQKQAKTAEEAATKVRTFTQFLGTVKESIASGWSETFTLLIGDFEQATEFWSAVNSKIGPILTAPITALNDLLEGWNNLGGREVLVEALGNAFEALGAILRPIKEAFREVFPPATGQTLYNLTVLFRDFTEKLKIGAPLASAIGGIFKTIFTILKLGVTIVTGMVKVVGALFGAIGSGLGKLFGLAGGLDEAASSFADMLDVGEKVEAFYSEFATTLQNVLGPVFDALVQLALGFGALATGDVDSFLARMKLSLYALTPAIEKVEGIIGNVIHAANALFKGDYIPNGGTWSEDNPMLGFFFTLRESIGKLLEKVGLISAPFESAREAVSGLGGASKEAGGFLSSLGDGLSAVATNVEPAARSIGEFIGLLFTKIKEWVSGLDFQDVLAIVNTAFFIMAYRAVKKFFDAGAELATSLSGIFDQLGSSLKTFEQSVKANAILKIAIALGILALSLYLLSKIPMVDLAKGVVALAVTMRILNGAMSQLADQTVKDEAKIVASAFSMILMAGAMLLMAKSIEKLGALDLASLAKGVVATGVVVGFLTAYAAAIGKFGGGGVAAGAGLILMAGAVLILSIALQRLGEMDLATLTVGGLALVVLLNALAGTAIALGLAGPASLAGAAGLIILAGAMLVFVEVLKKFDEFGGGAFADGVGKLAILLGVLAVMVVGLTFAGPAFLAGAAGLLVMAIAMQQFIKVVDSLMQMEFGSFVKAMAMLGGIAISLTILGTAALLAAPGFILLGAGVLLLGTGLLLGAVALTMFTAALTLLGTVGSLAVGGITLALTTFASAIPLIMQQVGLGIQALAVVLRDSGPEIVGALSTILASLIQAIRDNIPGFGAMLSELLAEGLRIIRDHASRIFDTGWYLLRRFIAGFRQNIPELVRMVGDLIVAFLDELGNNMDRILRAGANLIIRFVRGIAENLYRVITAAGDTVIEFLRGMETYIRENNQEFVDAGWDLVEAIIQGLLNGLLEGPRRLAGAVGDLGRSIASGIGSALGINSPSKVTTKQGQEVVAGLAVGMRKSQKDLKPVARSLADGITKNVKMGAVEAVDQFNTIVSKIGDGVKAEIDASPVVAPVLDLTKFSKDAKKMQEGVRMSDVNASVSYKQALNLAVADSTRRRENAAEVESAQTQPTVQFVQNNTSPESLSTLEIYRQTQNQLSMVERTLLASSA